MSTPVEQIKERLNIVDLLSSYIKLEKAGKNLKARCPFHNEKSPSFFVSPDRDSYYCFGCGAKGDIFTFVQEFEGLDFFGALKLLAERTGVEIVRENLQVKNDKEAIFTALEAAAQFFEANLPHAKDALAYLEKRGLSAKTIKDWRIGFVSEDWRTLYDYLKSRKYTDEQIEAAGLIKRNERSFYDRFRGRIMFPIRDAAGRVVGFTGRILPGAKDDTAKYLNSPETSVFNKSRLLYGFDLAKLAIKKFDYSVIVEGQMDLLMCHQAGFDNTVATSGTALTPEHLQLLKRISNRVIMAFDGDRAGFAAATKAWILALSLGMEVKIAELPSGVDPADLILKDKDQWKNCLKNSMHIVDFQLAKIIAENLDERKVGLAVREKVLPFIAMIDSSIERSHFITKISEKLKIKEEALWDDLKRVKVIPGVGGVETKIISFTKENVLVRKDSIERRILGILVWAQKDKEVKIDLNSYNERLKEIIGDEEFRVMLGAPEEIRNEAAFEAEQYYERDKLAGITEELLYELEKENLKKAFSKTMDELIGAEKAKDIEKMNSLSVKCNEITKKLAKFNK
ncbi:MAG: DNA primase [bacterium]